MALTGTVKFFDTGKGFGFIIQNNGDSDVFVHGSDVSGKGLNEGDTVQFDVEAREDGRSRAVKVTGGTRDENSFNNMDNGGYNNRGGDRGGNRGYNEGGYGGYNDGGNRGGNSYGGDNRGNSGGGQGICYSFRDSGECRFGDRCRFNHGQQN